MDVSHIGPTELFQSVPPRFLTFTFWNESVSPSSSIRSDRVGSNVCNSWILCGGYIYPSTPFSISERAIRTCLHFHYSFFEREPATHVLRPRYSNPTTRILISSLPQVAFHSNHLSTIAKSMRESWVLGRLSFEAQEQGAHHQHTVYLLLESGVS